MRDNVKIFQCDYDIFSHRYVFIKKYDEVAFKGNFQICSGFHVRTNDDTDITC
jgi:hypothetical protein